LQDIFVPPEQVIDTVDLYFLKARQRRLSLRFLSWSILHENIQIDVHDSIEDAYSALKLYKAYHEMEEKGIFDQKWEELYKEGRQYVSYTRIYLHWLCCDNLKQNWRPPPEAVQTAGEDVQVVVTPLQQLGMQTISGFNPRTYSPSPFITNFFQPSQNAFR
jgi:hypothetical protein